MCVNTHCNASVLCYLDNRSAVGVKAHSHPTVNTDTDAFVWSRRSSVSGSVASELTNPECSGQTGALPPEIEAAVAAEVPTTRVVGL